jgi:hypothetical protein
MRGWRIGLSGFALRVTRRAGEGQRAKRAIHGD